MSINSTIDICYKNKDLFKENAVYLLKCLMEAGWEVKSTGKISYLPLNHNDEFNWTSSNINESDLFRIIEGNIEKQEIAGVELQFSKVHIGGELLFLSDREISFSLSINRVNLEASQTILCTDFSWYLERLIEPMKRQGYIITSIECAEMI